MTPLFHRLLLRYRGAAAALVHVAIVALAYTLAFALRFDFTIPVRMARVLAATLPLIIA